MTEVTLGRLLAASLHQAIGELLPLRLEFYENWLHSEGLWDGSIGPAAMLGVLGFLRTEGPEIYDKVVSRAGELAAEWTLISMSSSGRRLARPLPRWFRIRRAMRTAREVAMGVNSGSRVTGRVRGGTVHMELTDSLFCTVRGVQPQPLCGFYRALVAHTFGAFALPAEVTVTECKATGSTHCVLEISTNGVHA
jgi:predicted hydrocarbon binding protein